MVNSIASVLFPVGKDIRGDLNQIAVELRFVPPGKDLVHLLVSHAESVAHQLICLADQLHVAVFNAVMHHLDKVPGTVFSDPVTAGRAVFHLCADALENRADMLPGRRRSSRHQRRALQCPFFSAGNTCSDVEQPFALRFGCAPHGVGEVAVAAVNQDITLFQQRCQRLNQCIHRFSRFDHHEDLARFLQCRYQLFRCVRSDKVLPGRPSVDKGIHFLRCPVVYRNGKAFGFHVHRQVFTHDGKSDYADICFLHSISPPFFISVPGHCRHRCPKAAFHRPVPHSR